MYTLKVNEKQLSIINEALSQFMRIESGQLQYGLERYMIGDRFSRFTPQQQQILIEINNSHDYNVMIDKPESAMIAFDLHQVVRHKLWHNEENPRCHTVDSSVYNLCPDVPLAEIDHVLPIIDKPDPLKKDIVIGKIDPSVKVALIKQIEEWKLSSELGRSVLSDKNNSRFSIGVDWTEEGTDNYNLNLIFGNKLSDGVETKTPLHKTIHTEIPDGVDTQTPSIHGIYYHDGEWIDNSGEYVPTWKEIAAKLLEIIRGETHDTK